MITGNDNTGMVMPVSPMYGGGGSGFGNGGFGGDWGWIILLLLLAGGGWGNGFGGFGGGNAVAAESAALYPWMNQADITTSGFQNAALNSAISSLQNSVTSGFGDVQTALCSGFAGVNAGIANGFAQSEIADNARQIASMQQAFASQTAMSQGFNQLASQFADCCCENRANIADLKYTVATENCADRAAVSEGIRDIITNQTANTQRILDQLCNDKIDAKNEKIADLERQLTMASLAASQTAQTASLQRGIIDSNTSLLNELRACPIPSQPVYGSQPIFTCPNNNNSCGCGCGNF